MIILAVDTATSSGGVAVYDDATGEMSECRTGAVKRQFSESIFEMIDLCLRNMGLTINEIDCLAVTSGPGSFTGLRVGLSTVKGLAYSTGKPVVAVSTLLAHAWVFPGYQGYVCPILDARKKEVYSGLFEWNGDDFRIVFEPGAYTIDEVLRHVNKSTLFLGDGLKVYRQEIESKTGDKARFAAGSMFSSFPSIVARLAAREAAGGEYTDPAALSPAYFRKSEAELKTSADI